MALTLHHEYTPGYLLLNAGVFGLRPRPSDPERDVLVLISRHKLLRVVRVSWLVRGGEF